MILALETSCDETAAALFDPTRGLVEEWVFSQMSVHSQYGGVVPDLATREHLRKIVPLLLEAKRQSDEFARVTQVAVTSGPGLAGCLAIGLASAKALSLALEVPLIPVNHLRGHAFSPFIALHEENPAEFHARLAALCPHLGLIVSGGNTLLFELSSAGRIRVLSSTRDDAAGEALDKGAKLLGLGYPGGPIVEKIATGGRIDAFDFPRGIGPRSNLDFSFSGLKTSLRYTLEKMSPSAVEAQRADLCASYQQAVVDALVRKTTAALEQGSYASVGVSGGVANNRVLRGQLEAMARRRKVPFYAAQPKHTGDNAGMIAFAAWADEQAQARSRAEVTIEPGLEL